MGRGQKKKPSVSKNNIKGLNSGKKRTVRKKQGNTEASSRFKKITERAQKIRGKHPKMKWKNCIKQASKELYR